MPHCIQDNYETAYGTQRLSSCALRAAEANASSVRLAMVCVSLSAIANNNNRSGGSDSAPQSFPGLDSL